MRPPPTAIPSRWHHPCEITPPDQAPCSFSFPLPSRWTCAAQPLATRRLNPACSTTQPVWPRSWRGRRPRICAHSWASPRRSPPSTWSATAASSPAPPMKPGRPPSPSTEPSTAVWSRTSSPLGTGPRRRRHCVSSPACMVCFAPSTASSHIVWRWELLCTPIAGQPWWTGGVSASAR